MVGIIKTAIITIIISFISGVLLDFYKGLAPKVLCSIKRGKPMMIGGNKINTYNLRIKNISNKTIHHLNLNVQGQYDNLKIDDADITKGLKFDISEEEQVYDVSIPFLCKNDEFTAKVFAYSEDGSTKKPSITLRSPEKFKKVYSDADKENGIVAAICNAVSNNKKAIAAIISVLVIVYAGITLGEHFGKIGNKINVDNIKNKINSVQKASGSDNSSNSGTETKSAGESTSTKASSNTNSSNTNSGTPAKSNTEKSQSQSSGNTDNNTENKKKEDTVSPADNGSDAGKTATGNDSNESKQTQQDNTKSGTDANDGAAGSTSNQTAE